MKQRLIRSTCVVTLLPLVTILLSYSLWESRSAQLCTLLLGAVLLAGAVTWFRGRLEALACPSDDVLYRLNVRPVAAVYQPGRFRVDLAIHRRTMYLGLAAPLCAYLARAVPYLPVDPALAHTLRLWLLGFALVLPVVGAVCLAFWARLLQAEAIADAVGERRRYLLRGFADLVDRPDFLPEYNQVTARLARRVI